MNPSRVKRLAAHASVVILFAGLVWLAAARVDYAWNWAGVWEYREMFLKGWLATVVISFSALVGSGLIGIFGAVCLQSRNLLLEALVRVYVELIRGTPLLVQLLIGFYLVATAVGLENRYIAGALILALFSGAYMVEIVRGGLAAIPRGQHDAAAAIGLSPWQSFWLVILPQAARIVLPPVAGQLASLIKDSSLLSVIAISEFTLAAQEVNAFTYSSLESYLPLAAGYLLLTLPLSWMAGVLERRFHYDA